MPLKPATMKTEPTAHTSGAELFAPPPSQPPPRQTTATRLGTQTTPSTPIPIRPTIPPKPRITRLQQLKQLDATLDEYLPVIGNILEKLGTSLLVGLIILVLAVIFVGGPIFLTGSAVLEAWRG
jgi:hypothetical protein